MVEKIVEHDDALLAKYLEGQEIDAPSLRVALRKAVIANAVVPILCGSALKNKGVQFLLDAVIDYLPSPLDLPPVHGIDVVDGHDIERKPSDEEPFTALAFKIATDPYVGSLAYVRNYAGILKKGSYVMNTTKGEQERVGRILRMHANQREEVDEVYAGEIAAVVGLKATTTGDTLTDPASEVILEKITFPEPVIAIRIEPKTKADQEKMGVAHEPVTDGGPRRLLRREARHRRAQRQSAPHQDQDVPVDGHD
jgi:elongation factor G